VQDQKNVSNQGTEEEISKKIIIEIIFAQHKKEGCRSLLRPGINAEICKIDKRTEKILEYLFQVPNQKYVSY